MLKGTSKDRAVFVAGMALAALAMLAGVGLWLLKAMAVVGTR